MDRSADFRNEVQWRLRLRSRGPSDYALAQYRRSLRLQAREEERRASKRKSERHVVVDTVGHLLKFSSDFEEGARGGEEEEERRRRDEERVRLEEEKEERVKEAVGYVKSQAAGRRGFLGV